MNADGPRRRPIVIDAASAAALVLLNFLLYRKVFTLWWTYDDANILRSMFEHPFLAPFIDRHVWPQQLFTPLLFMAFDAQWKFFAFNATNWYAVHLAVASVTTILVYVASGSFWITGGRSPPRRFSLPARRSARSSRRSRRFITTWRSRSAPLPSWRTSSLCGA